MDKIKLLTFAVIGLLLLNLTTLSLLFINPPKGNEQNHKRPQEIIVEKLHFDKKQQEQYGQIIHWHRGRITDLEAQIRETKQDLYTLLQKEAVDETEKNNLITILANYQKEIEATHFKHFEDIKKICRRDQIKDYNTLTMELSKIFSQKQRPPKRD
ncbi:periplasmic heavy metal sensor [Flavobacterium psychrotolerans]|uniref:Periplasmic heavy metal sensor n=1 Tax=Flavobacterium psychrotolerans TaxID=2169410 RepID=A0A2U1JL24_9FLAO|nr:periplasmic heavy metal sensor [Flavobacterium psychrotolerans]PWA05866.1 hypothetical protein DB895_05440 [Flavobacterium psychrotolerans]